MANVRPQPEVWHGLIARARTGYEPVPHPRRTSDSTPRRWVYRRWGGRYDPRGRRWSGGMVLRDDEIAARLAKMSGWQRADVGGKPGIRRTFKRKDFMDGLAFVTRVADLAEQANHHPDVLLTWPSVTLSLTTHDVGGLTDKDFALAARIETVA